MTTEDYAFSSFAKLDNLTVYSAGILPLFRGGQLSLVIGCANPSLYSTFVRDACATRSSFASRVAAGVLLPPGQRRSLHNRDMKPPPDVIFHRAERLMVWIPHGVDGRAARSGN